MIGDRIQKICTEVGSVKKLSELTGIGVRTLRTYLSNQSQPSAENLAKIVESTSVDSRWLLLGSRSSDITTERTMPTHDKKIDLNLIMKIARLAEEHSLIPVEFPPEIRMIIRTYNDVIGEQENQRELKARHGMNVENQKFYKRNITSEENYSPEDEEDANFGQEQIARHRAALETLKREEEMIQAELRSLSKQ